MCIWYELALLSWPRGTHDRPGVSDRWCDNKARFLLKSKADPAYLLPYLALATAITRLIVLGLVLLTLAGIGLLLLGHALTALLVVKLAMVVLIFVLGPLIDKVVEPRFRELTPRAGESHSTAFIRIQG